MEKWMFFCLQWNWNCKKWYYKLLILFFLFINYFLFKQTSLWKEAFSYLITLDLFHDFFASIINLFCSCTTRQWDYLRQIRVLSWSVNWWEICLHYSLDLLFIITYYLYRFLFSLMLRNSRKWCSHLMISIRRDSRDCACSLLQKRL